MIRFLKNGSGIHIKESQKGSFTKYCKGKVTNECIQKGKNSPDPKIRKKATFADNARKWKHKKGGSFKGYPSKAAYEARMEEVAGFKVGGQIIKSQAGSKLNFWQKAGNFLSSDVGKSLLNLGSNVLQTTAQNKQIDYDAESLKAQSAEQWNEFMNSVIAKNQEDSERSYQQWASAYSQGLTQDQPSQIVAQHRSYQKLNADIASEKNNIKKQNALIDAQAQSQKSSSWGDILSTGLGLAGSFLSKNSKGV